MLIIWLSAQLEADPPSVSGIAGHRALRVSSFSPIQLFEDTLEA